MTAPVIAESDRTVPLCVDLDGTLIKTDLLWESLIVLLKRDPLCALRVPFWLLRGRAHLKAELASRVEVHAASLPVNAAFLEYLQEEKRAGRPLYLVTASDSRAAESVARELNLFTEVLGSDGKTNLRGHNKGARLAARFGVRGFDYAGNSTVDLPVWQQARRAIVVNGSPGLASRARSRAEVSRVFEPEQSRVRALFQVLRPHQWVKNLIVFVPALTSHKLVRADYALQTSQAFLAFCLCASSVYVLNDLLDIEADRHHAKKRFRPFASGNLPISTGLVLFPALLAVSILLGALLSLRFAGVLGLYLLFSTAYSWQVKKIALLDVFVLSGLYTIRLVGGHAASHIPYSFWLLVFSMFIFLSLALVKRFVELDGAILAARTEIKGRGYTSADRGLVAALGTSSGYMAVLVLALYVNSPQVTELYRHPLLLLLICPLLLYWISRVWMMAYRGQMHEDPIVFALKDRVSYLVVALTLAIISLAAIY